MSPLVAFLAILATYRATLLVTSDTVSERPRSWVIRRGGWPSYLVTCSWCCSIEVGLVVAWSAWLWGDTGWWTVGALTLAASAVAGFLSTYAAP